ncbi:Trehalose synthase/amylase TreS [Streptomyces reticuli]|nr:Trehalose synthase/amylase TreS [Streptomyces reticuli]
MTVNDPVLDTFEDTPVKDRDPEWFKRAVFYEVLVRSFQDSNGDGVGDLKGLTAKLDYLQWLGVDCLWLPPFFNSPLRDGGYDVSDYTAVLPEFGDLADFVEFVDAAHQRGMRVIIDFVMNHTSDQHPWFQESRKNPDGPYGDYYMWADDDKQYEDARIIFVDTEVSNWTFDPVRGQYYFHRFFSHQPDLNYENPAVQEEILAALRFWLDLGIDGYRLDAVPYLYAEEGTNCENLPATHAFLKRVRREIDAMYPDTVLLAEANQWPEDVVDYFGDFRTGGDECHMAFHFPVMPRIFMAVRRESRYPVSEILAKTPAIPSGCQWGIFLRNHDELTLEMVTDEERDYMWAEYAKDPRMRANIGIRRRLAPLLDNDRNQIELFTALLLSLPGSPILYYGDEIGMGDNIWLGDRDAVRTPHAVDPRPQRRLLHVRPGTPLPAHHHGPGLRLPGHQRGSLHVLPVQPAALDPPHDRDPQAEPRLRARLVHGTAILQPGGPGVPARVRRRPRAVREQLLPLRPAHRTRPEGLRRTAPGRADRRGALPRHR